MYMVHFTTVLILFSCISLVVGHARIKYPRPLAAAVDSPAGNYYNSPLRSDGSDFPCKGLHKDAGVDQTPTETWRAGQQARFEILGHGGSGGEGSMAAHSGGSCQASLSFDNGETWKVLHSFTGGCPRGARMGSNIAGNNQTFTFMIPANTKAGKALFSWSWIAVTGNRNEFYQNCASVAIAGSGTSTLNDLPDMFVGDMTLTGHIGPGECRSFAGYALEYPNPGTANTIDAVQGIGFKKATAGKCFTRASTNNSTTLATRSSSATTITTRGTTSSISSTTSRVPSTTSRAPSTTVRASSTTTRAPSTTVRASSTTSRAPSTTVRASSTTTRPPSTTVRASSTTSIPVQTVLPPIGGLPAQCSNYMLITDKTRHSSQPGHIGCDNAIFKNESTWVRFSGAAGTRLINAPAEPFRCNTQGTGWYSGSYPSASGVTILGAKVCYSWPGNSCQWSNTISITNCNGYYVFALRAPPACFLRYCTI